MNIWTVYGRLKAINLHSSKIFPSSWIEKETRQMKGCEEIPESPDSIFAVISLIFLYFYPISPFYGKSNSKKAIFNWKLWNFVLTNKLTVLRTLILQVTGMLRFCTSEVNIYKTSRSIAFTFESNKIYWGLKRLTDLIFSGCLSKAAPMPP